MYNSSSQVKKKPNCVRELQLVETEVAELTADYNTKSYHDSLKLAVESAIGLELATRGFTYNSAQHWAARPSNVVYKGSADGGTKNVCITFGWHYHAAAYKLAHKRVHKLAKSPFASKVKLELGRRRKTLYYKLKLIKTVNGTNNPVAVKGNFDKLFTKIDSHISRAKVAQQAELLAAARQENTRQQIETDLGAECTLVSTKRHTMSNSRTSTHMCYTVHEYYVANGLIRVEPITNFKLGCDRKYKIAICSDCRNSTSCPELTAVQLSRIVAAVIG